MKRHLLLVLLLAACRTYDVSGRGDPGDFDGAGQPIEQEDSGKSPGRTPVGAAPDAGPPVLGTGALDGAPYPPPGAAPDQIEGRWSIERLWVSDTCRETDRRDVIDVTWIVVRSSEGLVNVQADDPTLPALTGIVHPVPAFAGTPVTLQSEAGSYKLMLTLARDVSSFEGTETRTMTSGCVVTRQVIGARR